MMNSDRENVVGYNTLHSGCCSEPACFLVSCKVCTIRNTLKYQVCQLLGNIAAKITGEEFWRTFFFKDPSICVLQHYNTLISIIDPARNPRMFDKYLNIYKGKVYNWPLVSKLVGYGADGRVVELEENEDTCLYSALRAKVKILLVKLLQNVHTSSETSKQIDENVHGMFKILKQLKSELIVVETNEVQAISTEGETSRLKSLSIQP